MAKFKAKPKVFEAAGVGGLTSFYYNKSAGVLRSLKREGRPGDLAVLDRLLKCAQSRDLVPYMSSFIHLPHVGTDGALWRKEVRVSLLIRCSYMICCWDMH